MTNFYLRFGLGMMALMPFFNEDSLLPRLLNWAAVDKHLGRRADKPATKYLLQRSNPGTVQSCSKVADSR
ncbi:MAG: hypothetical protein U5P41_13210 [Gammaproteobacteria bacterium]|nr:hypothetical protein [Gammaproteobacteria bacterium]